MTLAYKLDLVRVKMNHLAKCLRQRSFVQSERPNTHTHTSDRLHYLNQRPKWEQE